MDNKQDKEIKSYDPCKEDDFIGLLCVTVGNGKYTVIQEKTGSLKALRYGKEWRDCCGDGLIYALASEIEILRNKK